MDTKNVYAMLRAKGQRITAPKRRILDVFMQNQDRMLSVADVAGLLSGDIPIDNATIYRNIQKFLEIGLLESLNDEQGVNRYTVFEQEHHHYLICTSCGKIIRIPCAKGFWKTHAIDNDFEETHHKLEVYGKCSGCTSQHTGAC
ncbi:MAG TPA: Fur family transcriptional regulator [Candidatus Limiplasma sp.]|nr:Fur family transcriptional regulator [Candidatus Limiplasma sp.]HRX07970.1 Fur family transcriptional regulator [Candidatus Limiplasma sp.]